MEKVYNILTFMGFKPMTSTTKYFPTYEVSQEKALKILFDGIQIHDLHSEVFSSFWNLKEESLKNSVFRGIQTHRALLQNVFQLVTYQTRKPFKNQALMGFKPMPWQNIHRLWNIKRESLWNIEGES